MAWSENIDKIRFTKEVGIMNAIMRKVTSVMMILTLIAGIVVVAPAEKTFAASKPKVESVDYDAEDREVNIEFYGRVKWKKAKVRIYDSNGKNYAKYIIEKDNDDIDVKVKRLKLGKKYKYKVTGIKKRGSGKYVTVKGSFYAYDD